MAAPECEREVRKRRERRDSGSAHERKERRPHSEERPPPPPPPPPLHDHNRLESERRAERLSRARRPQYGGKRRRAARITKHPKENECFTTDIVRCTTPPNFDYAVIPKPNITDEPETLDAVALHRQASRVNSDEGSASVAESAAERVRKHERSEAPPHARRDQPSPDRKLEKISKKIIILKKNIAKYEGDYEAKHGHPLTSSDRITDVQLTRMYESLRKLQAEKRCIKADPVEYVLKMQALKQQKERDEKLNAALKSDKSMVELVKDIEEWLRGCREAAGRACVAEASWSPVQLGAEKACVQRALLRLEAARGRPPAHSADRGATRHLYERYRAVKRALASYRPDAIIGCTNGELATIHEHEPMSFNTSVDSSSDSQEKPSDSSQETTETSLQSLATARENPVTLVEEMPSSTSSVQSIASEEAPSNEGLHFLSLEELIRALADAKLQKNVLRRSIKEYEVSFELKNSRKVQRDDKTGHEEEYQKYKGLKARIKLLNALINKQKSVM